MLDMMLQLNLVNLVESRRKKNIFFGEFSCIFSSHRWWITDAALRWAVQPSSTRSSFAHPSCTSLLFILLFIKSQYTVCTSYFLCTFYSIAHFTLYFSFFTYIYICSCVVLLLYNLYLYSFALSTERT